MRYDAVVIGGGHSGCAEALRRASDGQKVCLVTAGLTLRALEPDNKEKPYAELYALTRAGVSVLRGDIAVNPVWEGQRLKQISTANGITLQAEEFVLATGRFFSRGLMADMDGIREPLFGADVNYEKDRSRWFDADFFAPQPFESFGVKTDKKGHILIEGKPAENVFAVGKILGGKGNAGK